MKRILLFLLCGWLLLSAATYAQSLSKPTDADKLSVLQTEVRQLRHELLQQRLEFQQWKIAQLETELQRTREEHERLNTEERAIQQAITEADTSIEDAIVTPRTELIENSLKKIEAQQSVLQRRETELQEKWMREQKALQEVETHLKQSPK